MKDRMWHAQIMVAYVAEICKKTWERSSERELITQLNQNVNRSSRMTAALQHRKTVPPFRDRP